MPVTLNGKTVANFARTSSIAFAKPSCSVGDVLVAVINVNAWTPPSGWNEYREASGYSYCYIAWRVVDGTEGSTITFTGSTTSSFGCLYSFSGVDTTTPIQTVQDTAGSNTLTGITVDRADSYLIVEYHLFDTLITFTHPSGMTEDVDTNSASYSMSGGLSSQGSIAAGATGSKIVTPSASRTLAYGSLFIVQPALPTTSGGAMFLGSNF